jgi:hypothetical protein
VSYLPLPITAEIAPGADPSASPGDWTYTDDGIKWRVKDGISLTSGQDDEDDETKPGAAGVTFDDRAGKLSPRNVLGEWYGEISNNTPIRFLLGSVEDDFARVQSNGWGTEPRSGLSWNHTGSIRWSVNGSAGEYTHPTPNTANYALLNNSIGTDIDAYSTISIDVTPTGGAWVHATVVRRDPVTDYEYRVHTEFATDGTIGVKIVRAMGTNTDIVGYTATGVTYVPGDLIHTHVQAIGKTIQTRVWKNADDEPTTWAASVSDSLVIGTRFGFYEWRIATGPASIIVSISDVRVKTSIWSGQVPEWPVRWPSKSGADCIAPVAASGVLRWLEQVNSPLTDPISQQLMAQAVNGYWTLYDGSGAVTAGSKLPRPRGVAASVVEGTFGNEDSPPGGLTSLALNTRSTSRVTGTVTQWRGTQDGYAVMCYLKYPTAPAASPAVPLMTISAQGTVAQWVLTADSSSVNLIGYNGGGTAVVTHSGILYAIDPLQWWALQIEAEYNSGTGQVTYAAIWHQVGSEDFFAIGGTYAGTARNAIRASVNAVVDGQLVSNLYIGRHTLPFVDETFMRVSDGYASELDTDRVARVLGEAGIEVIVESGDGVPLGPQPRGATAIEVARDAEKAGWGKLIERGPILGYLPYSARINPPVALALDFAQGHIAEDPEPVDDDLEIVNRWTSKRPSGSERTVEDEDSIARKRLYADGDEVNVQFDEQLEDDAGWHVAIGARDLMRWPRLVIDLHKNTNLIPAWLGCRQGSRVTVANLPEQVAGEVADLLIIGWQQTIRKHFWRVELSLTPAVPWVQVGVWGVARGDSTSTVLAEDLDASETAIDIVSTYLEHTWASAGGYTWNINGEPISVTSVTAPAGTPGAYTQTATVTRHPTLAKTHAAGRSVRLDRSQQSRWGLRH